jgi:SAM-dependent methyltransferase
VDSSPGALAIAREHAAGLACRFEVAEVPPLPAGAFDVVLLLETILAFPNKEPLLRAVQQTLAGGGRFAFTLEEGQPLTDAERARMPHADTVWLIPLEQMRELLQEAGLTVRWQRDWSRSHAATAAALADAFADDAAAIAAEIGQGALDALVASHRLWGEWLASGRVRKFGFVAEKP